MISKTTHIPWDLTGFHAPLVSVVVEGLKEGRIPLWDPYSTQGILYMLTSPFNCSTPQLGWFSSSG